MYKLTYFMLQMFCQLSIHASQKANDVVSKSAHDAAIDRNPKVFLDYHSPFPPITPPFNANS